MVYEELDLLFESEGVIEDEIDDETFAEIQAVCCGDGNNS